MAIYATGNIKAYQIWQSCLYLVNIPLAYISLELGYSPYYVVVIRFIIGLICSFVRVIQVKFQIGFSIYAYVKDVLMRALGVTIITLPIFIHANANIEIDSFMGFVLYYVLSFILIGSVIYTIGIDAPLRRNLYAQARAIAGKMFGNINK